MPPCSWMVVVLVPRSRRDGVYDSGRLCTPASAALGCLWWLPSGLKSCGDLLGLLEIFVGRAPEDEASRDSPDGDRNP